MSVSAKTAQPSPALIFETFNAYQRTAALKAAIELDIFSPVAKESLTAAELAGKIHASERGARILCDALTIFGLLEKQDGKYKCTPDSAMFLDKNSQAYIGCAERFLGAEFHAESFGKLAEAVRKGGTAMPQDGSMLPEHDIWVDFARGMAPLMFMPAEQIAQLLGADRGEPWKVLDIAAGHGVYGIVMARHNPKAKIVAVDWPNVLQVAKENAQKFGVADRHSTIPGSAFDVDFGKDYDVALLTGFMHHWDAATNEKLLRKVHAALKPGGRVAITEFVPNDDRVTPPQAAVFSLTMLAHTNSGDAYTLKQIESMARSAGFSKVEMHRAEGLPQSLVVLTK